MTEIGLIGKKVGMTREFYKTGQSVPVTVLKLEKARIIDVIEESKRGYKAVQIGFGSIKTSKISKAMKGFFSKKNTEAKKKLKEFRVNNIENFKPGNEFGLEIFKDIKFVDIRSKTIGKGFAGVMKRHNFSGQKASHGVHKVHRAGGSIGNASFPGHVFKGTKMPGRMGGKKTTIQNIEVVAVNEKKNFILVNGSVPGANGSVVLVSKSVKVELGLQKDLSKKYASKVIEFDSDKDNVDEGSLDEANNINQEEE